MSEKVQITQEGKFHFIKFIGDVDKAAMEFVFDTLTKFAADRDAVFVINVSELGSIPAEARKVASKRSVPWRYRALLVFGGSMAKRTLIQIIARGLSLVGKFDPDVYTFPDEGAAREWLSRLSQSQAPVV